MRQQEDPPAEPSETDSEEYVDAVNHIMALFEDENAENSDTKALELASKQLDKFQWMDDDVKFYFQQVEARMAAVGVKKQWTKFLVLQNILPMKIIQHVKSILRKSEAEFTDNMSYKTLKTEIMRIFGPRIETGAERAFKRTLVGKPSQLAREIIDDICTQGLTGPDLPGVVLAIWKKSLPTAVLAAIAGKEFNAANLDAILELADEVFNTCRSSGASLAAIKTVTVQSGSDGATGQVSSPTPASVPDQGATLVAEIAAIRKEMKAFRGSQSGKGIKPQNTGGRGGGRSAHGGRGASMSASSRSWGPRHADGPPNTACKQHWIWGASSYFCSDPLSCPWKDRIGKRPQ